jgi:16S rRNA (adenine1518-N6/adenine1519-N6)-dimethyltransferase
MKEHVARKRFGQNFLVDSGIIAAIVSAIGPQKDQTLVEIGPGLGAITEPLMARLDHLHVVEIDRDLIARLKKQHTPERMTIHEGDALNFDFATIGKDLRWSATCRTTSRRRCFSTSPATSASSMTCTSCCKRKSSSAW